MCFNCNDKRQVETPLGIMEECPYCKDVKPIEPEKEVYVPDNLVPAAWQNRKVGFNIDILTKAIKELNNSKYGLGGPEITRYLSYVRVLFDACKADKGIMNVQSALLSVPLTGLQDDLVYACLKLLVVRGYEASLVPYITGYELYDLVMGKYLPHNIDTFYAEVSGISKNLHWASESAQKFKNLVDQGLLDGIKAVKESRSPVKKDILVKNVEAGQLTEEDIDTILGVFNNMQTNLEQLAQFGSFTSKRGYTLDDYIAAPIVFINLGGSKPLFKYEIPGLSLLLDIRGRYGRPTIVTTHSPAQVYNKDPDGAGLFFKNYVNIQSSSKSMEKGSGTSSTLSEFGISSQGRLENVTCYRS